MRELTAPCMQRKEQRVTFTRAASRHTRQVRHAEWVGVMRSAAALHALTRQTVQSSVCSLDHLSDFPKRPRWDLSGLQSLLNLPNWLLTCRVCTLTSVYALTTLKHMARPEPEAELNSLCNFARHIGWLFGFFLLLPRPSHSVT